MSLRTQMSPMSIIVAVDEAGGFGKDGKIPWHVPEDFKHFQEVTKGNVCIMGRRTYEDMLEMRQSRDAKKPNAGVINEILPGRESFVVTRNSDFNAPGATVVNSIRDAIHSLDEADTREVFILGGYRMFVEALTWVNVIHMTIIKGVFDCDRFFPIQSLKAFDIVGGEETDKLRFVTYKRRT